VSDARKRILERLRANRPETTPSPARYRKTLGLDREARVDLFTRRMQAVRGEVHRVGKDEAMGWLTTELPERGLQQVLVGNGDLGDRLAGALTNGVKVQRYDRPVDEWKATLFNDIDVAVTRARAGLAESGSLVLWPDADEPRLMSLVPPMHIALLDVDRLYENFAEAIDVEGWANGMPTNALLISGPSKTADIEQTLAFGIHGPKQLITLLLD
jgi:L-lactate dehydrogenase complex protein LldG